MLAAIPVKRAPLVVGNFRAPNSRSTVLVDPRAFGVVDPSTNFIGEAQQPIGRSRLLYALPLDPGPALLSPATVVRDGSLAYLVDPAVAMIGESGPLWISRMMTALPTEDTRGMGGP